MASVKAKNAAKKVIAFAIECKSYVKGQPFAKLDADSCKFAILDSRYDGSGPQFWREVDELLRAEGWPV